MSKTPRHVRDMSTGGQALHPAEQAVAQLMLSLEVERERASALQARIETA